MVSISFGVALVAGRVRVPSPATGNTALRTRCCMKLLDGRSRPDSWRAVCVPSKPGPRNAPAYNVAPAALFNASGLRSAVQQDVAGAVDLGAEIVGAAVVGVELLHQ